MQGKDAFTFLVPLMLISIVFEALVLYRRKCWNSTENMVNISLGISNFVASIMFAGIHLAFYQYLFENFSLFPQVSKNLFLQLLAAFLLYDFLYYFNHWAHHRYNILWANHLVHHSGKHFNLTTAMRLGFFGNFTVWIFFLPMSLLGISLDQYLLIVIGQFAYQFFIHTTLVPELNWLEKIFVTPSQHRVHHACNPQYLDKNFGCFLVVWDRLFGTYQRELTDNPPRYGVTSHILKPYSPGFLNSFIYLECLRLAWRQANLKSGFGILLGSPKLISTSNSARGLADSNKIMLVTWLELISPLLIRYLYNTSLRAANFRGFLVHTASFSPFPLFLLLA